jgi:hypothetical protein
VITSACEIVIALLLGLPLGPAALAAVKQGGRQRRDTVFPTLEAAQKRARDLKAEFPMLQVKVYDAAEKKFLKLSPTE